MADTIQEVIDNIRLQWANADGTTHHHFDLNGAIGLLLIDEQIDILPLKDECLTRKIDGGAYGIAVLEYDVFAWGYTSWELVSTDDIPSIFDDWVRDRSRGTSAWLIRRAKQPPQAPLLREMAHTWDIDALVRGEDGFLAPKETSND